MQTAPTMYVVHVTIRLTSNTLQKGIQFVKGFSKLSRGYFRVDYAGLQPALLVCFLFWALYLAFDFLTETSITLMELTC